MNIEREETGTLTATLKLKLVPEDYTPGVEKTLREQRKTASMPGFRPGQVPMSLIKKRIGRSEGGSYVGSEPVRRPAPAVRQAPAIALDEDDDEPRGGGSGSGGAKKKRYYN